MIQRITDQWRRYANNVRKGVDTFLNGSHAHFSWYLPRHIGLLSSFALRVFFSGITLNPMQLREIKQLPDDAIIIYVNKFKSKFEYLFYYSRYKEENLPLPQLGFEYPVFFWQPLLRLLRIMVSHVDFILTNKRFPDPYTNGYVKSEMFNHRGGFLSLVEKKGFYRRFFKDKTDPFQYFIDMQKETDRPVYFVPQIMFFGKKPPRATQKLRGLLFRSERQPGFLRKIIFLFKTPDKIFVDVSAPLNLKEFISRPEHQNIAEEHLALILRRDLLVQMNRHRQSITGPALKTRQELKESILTNESLQDFITQYATKRNQSIYAVRREADRYLDEIAANYSMTIVSILKSVVEWLTRIMFDGVSYNEEVLNKIKFMSFRGPLVLVPCHKSHIDYLIISYILFVNNMQIPHIAAGQNLSFWPLGPIFRGGGAFFLRRTFRGAVLYSRIFSEYVFKMLKEGFNIEFFIEGGRSRTGKLLPPKLGLLNILLNAHKDGACGDMIFVPVYIGYDRVIEESAYLHELEGGQKKSEDFSQLIKAGRFLKKRYGKIYIEFNDPMPLNDMLGPDHSGFAGMSAKEQNAFCRNLANKIMHGINQKTVITPHALVAGAILNRNGSRFTLASVKSHIKMYINFLVAQNIKLSDTLLIDSEHAVAAVIEDYARGKLIEAVTDPVSKNEREQTHYLINENKRPSLEYYKNNCVNFFVPAALTALAILKQDAFQFSTADIVKDYCFFQDLFRMEFTFDSEIHPKTRVKKSISAFMEEAAIVPHPTLAETYNMTSAGFRKCKTFALFLASYLESYLAVLHFYKTHPDVSEVSKDQLKKIHSIAETLYKEKFIERKESISKFSFANALETFSSNGMLKDKNKEKCDAVIQEIQTCLNVLRN